MFEVEFYKDEKGCKPAWEYVASLTRGQRKKILVYVDRLASQGYGLKRPIVDYLGGGLGLYELRPDCHRLLYFFYGRTKIVILHAFRKQTDAITQRDVNIALKRKKIYLGNEVSK